MGIDTIIPINPNLSAQLGAQLSSRIGFEPGIAFARRFLVVPQQFLRRLGVPIAQIRDVLERVGDCPNILEIEQAVSMLRAHLDMLRSKHVEISRQIEQTATLVETRAA